MLRPTRPTRALFLAMAVVLLTTACASDDQRPELVDADPSTSSTAVVTTAPAPTTTTPADPFLSTVAYAVVTGDVPVYTAASTDEVASTLVNPTPIGAPLVFLMKEDLGEWLEVYLPLRPNGATGFVPRSEVDLRTHRYSITVTLDEFSLVVRDGDEVLLDTEIGVARDNAPTPGGFYYTTELLAPPNPAGAYGPYAYGLSGYSDTFETFNGGPGQLGIHGTNEPDAIGSKVSSGCIRLRNDDVVRMAETIGLPLGVPVTIIA